MKKPRIINFFKSKTMRQQINDENEYQNFIDNIINQSYQKKLEFNNKTQYFDIMISKLQNFKYQSIITKKQQYSPKLKVLKLNKKSHAKN